jgi:hypothetical protein
MPITEEQRLERNAKARERYAKKKAEEQAKEEENARKASAGAVIRAKASRVVASGKLAKTLKSASVLSSALKRGVANRAYVKEKEQSMLSTKSAGAGVSPPKTPKKSSPAKPTKTYEFDKECGVYYKKLTLSKENFMNINFIPVGKNYGNMKIGAERKKALEKIYFQGVGFGKGRFVYNWTDEEHAKDKCVYWNAIQEGIKLNGGLDVAGEMGGYLIIVNYGKPDKEILLYAEQYQRASIRMRRGTSPVAKDAIFYATEYHRDRYAFSGENMQVFD